MSISTPEHKWPAELQNRIIITPFAPKSELCDACKLIDHNSLFSDTLYSHLVGDSTQIKARQHCIVCRACAAVLKQLEANCSFQSWFSLANPCMFILESQGIRTDIMREANGAQAWHSIDGVTDVLVGPYAFLRISKADASCRQPQEPRFIIQHSAVISGPSGLLVGQSETGYLTTAKLQRIAEAVRACKRDHRTCDGIQQSPQASCTFRLINVRNRTVMVADPESPYAALSYIWGSGHRPRLTSELYRTSGVMTLPNTLPKTIEDVLLLVRLLGIEFLWIDAYCIDQSNQSELQESVANMDSVYLNASVTICPLWHDSQIGLPGIRFPFNNGHVQDIGNTYVCSTYRGLSSKFNHPLEQEIMHTPWHGRGWIFQESLLSRQRLLFMPSSVLLLCRGQSLSTHYYTRIGDIQTGKQKHVYTDIRLRQAIFQRTWSFDTYHHLVRNFNARRLTFDGDAHNAIRGLLNQISKNTGMRFIHALPEDDMLNALLWHGHGRRHKFPSWSWLNSVSSHSLWLRSDKTPTEVGIHEVVVWDNVIHGQRTQFHQVKVQQKADLSIDKKSSKTLLVDSEVINIRIKYCTGNSQPTQVLGWIVDYPSGNVAMERFHSELTRKSRFTKLDTGIEGLQKMARHEGTSQISLVLLLHLSELRVPTSDTTPQIGDIVIGIAVKKTSTTPLTERIGLLAVPYAFWVEMNPIRQTVHLV